MSNFSICHAVFKSRMLHMYQNASSSRKGLMHVQRGNFQVSPRKHEQTKSHLLFQFAAVVE